MALGCHCTELLADSRCLRFMRNLGILLFALVTAVICAGQTAQETKVPSRCIPKVRKRNSFPKGAFNFLPNESCKRSPIVKFQINEDRTVSNTKVTRSSGVADIDKKVADAIAGWRYAPRPGCPVIESEMSMTIDWE
jgi:TonB family protein